MCCLDRKNENRDNLINIMNANDTSAAVERIAKPANRLLMGLVRVAKSVLTPAKEISPGPNVKSSCVAFEIINSTPAPIVRNWRPVRSLEVGMPKMVINTKSTNKPLSSLRKKDMRNFSG